jgi:hypothetical protein
MFQGGGIDGTGARGGVVRLQDLQGEEDVQTPSMVLRNTPSGFDGSTLPRMGLQRARPLQAYENEPETPGSVMRGTPGHYDSFTLPARGVARLRGEVSDTDVATPSEILRGTPGGFDGFAGETIQVESEKPETPGSVMRGTPGSFNSYTLPSRSAMRPKDTQREEGVTPSAVMRGTPGGFDSFTRAAPVPAQDTEPETPSAVMRDTPGTYSPVSFTSDGASDTALGPLELGTDRGVEGFLTMRQGSPVCAEPDTPPSKPIGGLTGMAQTVGAKIGRGLKMPVERHASSPAAIGVGEGYETLVRVNKDGEAVDDEDAETEIGEKAGDGKEDVHIVHGAETTELGNGIDCRVMNVVSTWSGGGMTRLSGDRRVDALRGHDSASDTDFRILTADESDVRQSEITIDSQVIATASEELDSPTPTLTNNDIIDQGVEAHHVPENADIAPASPSRGTSGKIQAGGLEMGGQSDGCFDAPLNAPPSPPSSIQSALTADSEERASSYRSASAPHAALENGDEGVAGVGNATPVVQQRKMKMKIPATIHPAGYGRRRGRRSSRVGLGMGLGLATGVGEGAGAGKGKGNPVILIEGVPADLSWEEERSRVGRGGGGL